MNKKQLIVTSVLVSLMLILVMAQRLFEEKFKQVSISGNGVSKSIDYNLEDNYAIALPEEWNVCQTESGGDYISYTADFKDNDNNIAGIIYIINTNTDVKAFAERDLKNQSLEYSNLELTPVKVKGHLGVMSQYNTNIKDGYNFKNTCYYLELGENKILKVLFNCKTSSYNEDKKEIFDSIISSIQARK